jgi:hypothetical protein
MPNDPYPEVRDLIVQTCCHRFRSGDDVSAIVLERLADIMAREVDQASEPHECVRLAMFALHQAVCYLHDSIRRGNNKHRWTADTKNLRTEVMTHLEKILDRECDRLQAEPITRDPPPERITCPGCGHEVDVLGDIYANPADRIQKLRDDAAEGRKP